MMFFWSIIFANLSAAVLPSLLLEAKLVIGTPDIIEGINPKNEPHPDS